MAYWLLNMTQFYNTENTALCTRHAYTLSTHVLHMFLQASGMNATYIEENFGEGYNLAIWDNRRIKNPPIIVNACAHMTVAKQI